MKRNGFCLLTLVLYFCLPVSEAQTVTGTISGTVADSTGAVIPGVTISARNIGTGI